MFKGFKEFILRGNVVDLAVAVVIGAAFTAIVNGLVEGILNPAIALLFDAGSLEAAGIVLREGVDGGEPVILSWGRVISAVIQFLLVATVIYFALVLPMNYLKRITAAKKDVDPTEPAPTETQLLAEIRDLLKEQKERGGGDASPTGG